MAVDESNDNLISVANGLISGSSSHLTNAWFQLQHAAALFFCQLLAWLMLIDTPDNRNALFPSMSFQDSINSTVDMHSTQNFVTVFADMKYNSMSLSYRCNWSAYGKFELASRILDF